jgi:aspartate/methionine/tyrosine aminotransferase
VVVIGGLDDVLPGWRVGWLAGSEVAEKLRSLKQSMTICTTSVSQWAAVALMNTDDPA